jgi:hypothetical protein
VQIERGLGSGYLAVMETKVSRVGQKRRRDRAEWRREVRTWKESGLAAAEYAAKHDLKPSTLMWWSSMLKRADHESRSTTEKRAASPLAPGRAGISFLPVRVARKEKQSVSGRPLRAEILLTGGRRVRIGHLTVDQLAAMVNALEAGARC